MQTITELKTCLSRKEFQKAQPLLNKLIQLTNDAKVVEEVLQKNGVADLIEFTKSAQMFVQIMTSVVLLNMSNQAAYTGELAKQGGLQAMVDLMTRNKELQVQEFCSGFFANMGAVDCLVKALSDDAFLTDLASFKPKVIQNASAAAASIIKTASQTDADDLLSEMTFKNFAGVFPKLLINLNTVNEKKKPEVPHMVLMLVVTAMQYWCLNPSIASAFAKAGVKKVVETLMQHPHKPLGVQAGKLLELLSDDEEEIQPANNHTSTTDNTGEQQLQQASDELTGTIDLIKNNEDPDKQYFALTKVYTLTKKKENCIALRDRGLVEILLDVLYTCEYVENLDKAAAVLADLCVDPTSVQIASMKNGVAISSKMLRIKEAPEVWENVIVILGKMGIIVDNARLEFATYKIYELLINLYKSTYQDDMNKQPAKNQKEKKAQDIITAVVDNITKMCMSFAMDDDGVHKMMALGYIEQLVDVYNHHPNAEISKNACVALWSIQRDDTARERIPQETLEKMIGMLDTIDLYKIDPMAAKTAAGLDDEALRKAAAEGIKDIDVDALVNSVENMRSWIDNLTDDEEMTATIDGDELQPENPEDVTDQQPELKPADEDDEDKPLEPDQELKPAEEDDEVQPAELQPAEDDELQPAELQPAEEDDELKPAELQPADEEDELKPAEIEEKEDPKKKKPQKKQLPDVAVEITSEPEELAAELMPMMDKRRSVARVSQLTVNKRDSVSYKRDSVSLKPKLTKEELEKQKEDFREKKKQDEEKKKADQAGVEKRFQKRKMVTNELLTTEENYVDALDKIKTMFMVPLQTTHKGLISEPLFNQIFSNVNLIHMINAAFLTALKKVFEKPDFFQNVEKELGLLFSSRAGSFKQYTKYVNSYPQAEKSLLDAQKGNKKFSEFLADCSMKLLEGGYRQTDLSSFLIMPIQRLPRYSLLLQDILKGTDLNKSMTGYSYLVSAMDQVQKTTAYVNEKKKDVEKRQKVLEIGKKLGIKTLFDKPERLLVNIIKDITYATFEKARPKASRSKEVACKLYVFNDMLILASHGIKLVKKIYQFPLKSTVARKKAADIDKSERILTLHDKDQTSTHTADTHNPDFHTLFDVTMPDKHGRDDLYNALLNAK